MKKLFYILVLIPFFTLSCGGNKEQKADALHLQREAKDALFINNDIATANHLIDNAIELAPSLVELYITKADLLTLDSLFDEALVNIDKAIERKDIAEYQLLRGLILQAMKDTVQAISTYNKALEMYEVDIVKRNNIEDALYNKYYIKAILSGDKESNIAELKAIVAQDSTLYKPRLEMNILLMEQNEIQYLN